MSADLGVVFCKKVMIMTLTYVIDELKMATSIFP